MNAPPELPLAWSAGGQNGYISLHQVWQDSHLCLYADHADPEILISHDVIDTLLMYGEEYFLLRKFGVYARCSNKHEGTLVKFATVNRGTLVYQLTQYEPGKRSWIARWPD